MKTLLSLCISLLLTRAIEAQIPSPEPPITGTWTDIRDAQLVSHLRQPPPPPAGGFWVVEDHVERKSPTIIRYYTNLNREIQADTLPHKRLNIKKLSVVHWLNNRLGQALSAQVLPVLATYRKSRN